MDALLTTNAPKYYKFAGRVTAMKGVKDWMNEATNNAKLATLVGALPTALQT